MSKPVSEQWWLVFQPEPPTPLPDGTRRHPLSIERLLTPAEAQAVREANRLITYLANATPYARLVDLFNGLEAAAGTNASNERKAAGMNRAAQALSAAARELPELFRASLQAQFGDGHQLAEFDMAIAEETSRSSFRALLLIEEGKPEPFATDGTGIVVGPSFAGKLARQVPELSGGDLAEVFAAAVVVAQRLVARHLLLFQELIVGRTLLLRQLAAEVPVGAPGLMRDDHLDLSSGTLSLTNPRMVPLAILEGQQLYLALAHSHKLLAETDLLRAQAQAPNTPGSGEAPAQEPEPAAQPGNTDDPDKGLPAAPLGGRDDQALDLGLAADHATTLTDDLERAWSDALDAAQLGAARRDFEARFGSLLELLKRRSAARGRELDEAGVDTTIIRYPLGDTEVAALTLTPDRETKHRQLQLAEIETLELMLEAFRAIQRPSATKIKLATGSTERFWEAGAFDLLRSRTRSFARVSTALGHADRELTGEEIDRGGNHELLDRLLLAGEALEQGNHEAVLLQCLIVLRLRCSQEIDQMPDDLPRHLAANIGDVTKASLLEQLGAAADDLHRGAGLDLGAATLISPRVLELTGLLCYEDAALLRTALGLGEPDAG